MRKVVMKGMLVAAIVLPLNGCYSFSHVAVKIPANTEEIPPDVARAYLESLPVRSLIEYRRCVYGAGTITSPGEDRRGRPVAANKWEIESNEIHWSAYSNGRGETHARLWLESSDADYYCAVYDEAAVHGSGEDAKRELIKRNEATMRRAIQALKAYGVDVSAAVETAAQAR